MPWRNTTPPHGSVFPVLINRLHSRKVHIDPLARETHEVFKKSNGVQHETVINRKMPALFRKQQSK